MKLYRAYGTGRTLPSQSTQELEGKPDDSDYRIEIRYGADAPTLPYIEVTALSAEVALSTFERVRALLMDRDLFGVLGPTPDGLEPVGASLAPDGPDLDQLRY